METTPHTQAGHDVAVIQDASLLFVSAGLTVVAPPIERPAGAYVCRAMTVDDWNGMTHEDRVEITLARQQKGRE